MRQTLTATTTLIFKRIDMSLLQICSHTSISVWSRSYDLYLNLIFFLKYTLTLNLIYFESLDEDYRDPDVSTAWLRKIYNSSMKFHLISRRRDSEKRENKLTKQFPLPSHSFSLSLSSSSHFHTSLLTFLSPPPTADPKCLRRNHHRNSTIQLHSSKTNPGTSSLSSSRSAIPSTPSIYPFVAASSTLRRISSITLLHFLILLSPLTVTDF